MSIDHKTIVTRFLYPNGFVHVWIGDQRKPNRLTKVKPAFSTGFRGSRMTDFRK